MGTAVLGVNDLDEGPGLGFLDGESEGSLPGGVQPSEVSIVAEDAEHVDGVHEVGILGGNGHLDVEAQRGELPSEGFGDGRIVLQDEELPLRARHWGAVASWV